MSDFMSDNHMNHHNWNLPDPETQSEFYRDVNAKRLAAFVIDLIVTLLLSTLIVFFTALVGLFIFPFIILATGFVYRALTVGRHSATWGMRFLAIELRDSSGQKLGQTQGWQHALGFTLSIAFPVLQFFSIFLMLTTARGQGLTDHVMKTVVINRRAGN